MRKADNRMSFLHTEKHQHLATKPQHASEEASFVTSECTSSIELEIKCLAYSIPRGNIFLLQPLISGLLLP